MTDQMNIYVINLYVITSVAGLDNVFSTQADAMGWMSVEMELMRMVVDLAAQTSSDAEMEFALMRTVYVTMPMTVEMAAMNLDVAGASQPSLHVVSPPASTQVLFAMECMTAPIFKTNTDALVQIITASMDFVHQTQAGAMG